MKKIGIITSGGDVPGLNAAIRSVVITAMSMKVEVVGIHNGYDGLIEGDFSPLTVDQIRYIGNLGGTILKSSRSKAFHTNLGQEQAYNNLLKHHVDGLIIIGGDGSFRGITAFTQTYSNIPVIGIPKTIDNDIDDIDKAIGFDTALNTVVEALDKLRDTAESHNRIFIVEVMGRDAGFIACYSGLAAAADGILVPETKFSFSNVLQEIKHRWQGMNHSLILVVAEGDDSGGAMKLSADLQRELPETKIGVCILGHIQRGGTPSFFDRYLATRLGFEAATTLISRDKKNVMVALNGDEVVYIPFEKVRSRKLKIDNHMFSILKTLSHLS